MRSVLAVDIGGTNLAAAVVAATAASGAGGSSTPSRLTARSVSSTGL